MRIAFVTDSYDGGISGGVITAVRFVEALRRDHDVVVVAPGPPAAGKVRVPGFQLPLRSMRENHITFGWPRRQVLERVFSDVDVVHVHFPFTLGVAAVRIARRMQVPTVAAFHVQPENVLRNIGMRSPRLSAWLYRFWNREFYQRADAVVCPSAFAAERLRQYGLTKPTWVVSNGVLPCAAPLPTERRFSSLPHLVLCVGRLAAEKRQDVIIDAVARCRHRGDIRLVIAGAGPLEAALRARARERGVAAEFGYVSDQRLTDLRAQAQVFVHASEVELEGMAVVEAMAAGLPVLVADAPDSAARRLASGPEFLFRPGDAADLADRLDALLERPVLLVEAARTNLQYAARHSFQQSVRQLEGVYAAVAAGRTAGSAAAAVAARAPTGSWPPPDRDHPLTPRVPAE
jgi:1,2-diacylglycerol 3-alpha-glucosyltransferase